MLTAGMESTYHIHAQGLLREQPERVVLSGIVGQPMSHALLLPAVVAEPEVFDVVSGLPCLSVAASLACEPGSTVWRCHVSDMQPSLAVQVATDHVVATTGSVYLCNKVYCSPCPDS